MKLKVGKNNIKKLIAIVLIVALGFLMWQEPINSKASGENNSTENNDVEVEPSFRIDLEDGSYVEYEILDNKVACTYYEYKGTDENGEAIYEVKVTEVEVSDGSEYKNRVTRGGEGPLYWKKVVKDRLKKEYFYQTGVQGDNMFYKIGGEQKYVIHYSKIENTAYVDEYINAIDSVNKQIVQCFAVAIGSVMLAISAIIASYISVGASMCLGIISQILNKVGVTLVQVAPISFGKMVFDLYDDYVDLEKKFAMAATYGIPE